MVQVVGKDSTVVKRITCRNCSSILEYVPSEVQTQVSEDYGGGTDVLKYINCPCCTQKVTISHY